MSPGAGSVIRRRCQLRSKSGSSSHDGGASRIGAMRRRERKVGASLVARSMRAQSTSKSGTRSKTATETMVDRSNGSRSRFMVNSSASLMRASKISAMLPPPERRRRSRPTPPAEGDGLWAP